jgi:hypothetical protein
MEFQMIKRITGKWVLLLLLLVSVLMYVVCTEYPNPFLDKSLSKATADNKSFQNGDTVLIFSSETISVVTYLREYIKEVSVHIDSNRFWSSPDTVFHEEDLTTEPIIIPISFYDTGWNKIIISTKFKNDETKTEIDSLFAQSPLFQYAIVAVPGDSIHLKTNSVMDDRDVFYVWDFQDGTPEINRHNPKFDFVLKNAFSKPQGKLYVTDLNNHQSPPFLFETIADSEKKLNITSANDSIRGDTIYTGEPNFTFKVYINGPFKSALVNGLLFDSSQTSGTGYQISKTFNNLDTLLDPMKASVVVIDKNNESIEKIFYIKYDENQANLPEIIITTPNIIRDTANVLKSVLPMKGYVTGNAAGEKLYINFSLNGFDKGNTCIEQENNEWIWTYTLNLKHGWNQLRIYLTKDSNSGSSAIVSKEIQIKYDSTKFDSRPPRIIDIKVDGVAISKGEIFTSSNATSVLTFVVDEDDTIKAVTVNNDTIQAQPDGVTYNVSIQPVHKIGGLSYIISAADNNNTKTDSVTIVLNHTPEIDFVSLPTSMEINSTYNFIVKASDGDVGDKLEKTIKIKRPGGDSIITLTNDTVAWKPALADTGENTIFVYVRDDFFDSDETTMVSKVYQKTDKPLKVSWLTTAADFPSSIIAGKETLSKKLMLDSGTGTAPFSFTVTMDNPFKVIYEGSDAQFTWAPKRSDAGVRTLHFYVKDAIGENDTIDVLMTITAHPAAEVSFINQTMTVNENSTNDVALLRLSAPIKDSVIIPYSIKIGTTSSSDIDMPSSGTVVFIPGDTLAELPIKLINDSITEQDKKFIIALSDLPPLSDKDSIALNKSRSTLEVTIHDDDKRMIRYSFVGSAASGPENKADVFIVVTLDTVLDRDLTMTYYLDKNLSTVNDSDFAFANTNKTLSFKAGDTVDTFKIIITNDSQAEADKVLVLKLQTDDPILIPGANTSFQYTIIDDDRVSKVQVMFQPPTLRVKEGAQPSAPLIYLSTPLQNDITVTIKATEVSSAKLGFYNDYMIPGNKIDVKANSQSQSIGLWIVKDNNAEQEEYVEFEIIAISDTVHAEISPSLKSSKVFITDQ